MLGTFTIVPACVHHSAIQSAYMLLGVVNQSSCDWSCITNVENHWYTQSSHSITPHKSLNWYATNIIY